MSKTQYWISLDWAHAVTIPRLGRRHTERGLSAPQVLRRTPRSNRPPHVSALLHASEKSNRPPDCTTTVQIDHRRAQGPNGYERGPPAGHTLSEPIKPIQHDNIPLQPIGSGASKKQLRPQELLVYIGKLWKSETPSERKPQCMRARAAVVGASGAPICLGLPHPDDIIAHVGRRPASEASCMPTSMRARNERCEPTLGREPEERTESGVRPSSALTHNVHRAGGFCDKPGRSVSSSSAISAVATCDPGSPHHEKSSPSGRCESSVPKRRKRQPKQIEVRQRPSMRRSRHRFARCMLRKLGDSMTVTIPVCVKAK